jgi:hypothetical protein
MTDETTTDAVDMYDLIMEIVPNEADAERLMAEYGEHERVLAELMDLARDAVYLLLDAQHTGAISILRFNALMESAEESGFVEIERKRETAND